MGWLVWHQSSVRRRGVHDSSTIDEDSSTNDGATHAVAECVMVTAKLADSIVWVHLSGEVTYEQFLEAVNPIFESGKAYIGFISDGRQIAGFRSAEDQKRLQQHHATHNPGKPNAIVMERSGKMMLAKVYMRFTGAKDTRIFDNEKDAEAWVREHAKT